jgi:hypothetical protein
MKTITIIFMGLIAHVNQPWSLNNTAVIPNAPGHRAEMKIPKGAMLNQDDPWFKQKLNQETYVIPLQGIKVRVNKTRGVFSGLTPELIAAMPPLKTLAPLCKLKDEVRKRTTTSNLASFIDYRGGRLSPDTYFSEKLVIEDTPWKNGRCVVCRIRYEADLSGNEGEIVFTQADGTKHVARIATNSVLEVENTPVAGEGMNAHDAAAAAEGQSHFQEHYSIFKPCNRPKGLRSEEKCDKKEICPFTAGLAPVPFADCTNSHYP